MEDKANQALENLLDRAISGVDQAVEFSQAQIPDVVEQLLLWHATESAIFMALGILMVVAPPAASMLLSAEEVLSRTPRTTRPILA